MTPADRIIMPYEELLSEQNISNPTPDDVAPSERHLGKALVDLMLSIRSGQEITIPTSKAHPAKQDPIQTYLAWTSHDQGAERSVKYNPGTGQYWVEGDCSDRPYATDDYNTFDKLIDAVRYGYDILTYCDDQGDAILAWNRESHGNHPAIVLTHDDWLVTYYQAPPEIAEQLRSLDDANAR